MRQFLGLRFWMSVVAVIGLAVGVWLISHDAGSALVGAPKDSGVAEHRIDLVSLVYAVGADAGFAMVDGVAKGDMRLVLDGTRTMVIKSGTPGVVGCHRLAELGRCVVAADLLGEAVLWFELIDAEPRATVVLPAVRTLLADGYVLLANGWQVRHASKVERVCATDTTSLTDFIRRFGDKATSTFDLSSQRVVTVTCGSSGP